MVRKRTTKGTGHPKGLRSSKRIKEKDVKVDKPSKNGRRSRNEDDIPLSEMKTKLKYKSKQGAHNAAEEVTSNNSAMKQSIPKESKTKAERNAEKLSKSCKDDKKDTLSPKKRKLSNMSGKTAKSKRLKGENEDDGDCNNDTDITESPQNKHSDCKILATKGASNNSTPKKSRKLLINDDALIPNGTMPSDLENNVECVNASSKREEIKASDNSDSGDDSESGDDSDDNMDWEDVQEAEGHHSNNDTLPTTSSLTTDKNKSVEISIEVTGMKGRKRKKVQEDLMTTIQKAMDRLQRQIQLDKHKVHLLLLISVGFHRNAVCNQPFLQALCLSYIPHQLLNKPRAKWQLDDLTNLLTWFKEEFPSLQQLNLSLLKAGMASTSELPKDLAEVLVALLRSLGLLTRLVSSLQPVPMKISAKSKPSTNKQSKRPQSSKKAPRKAAIQESPKDPPKQLIKKESSTCTQNNDGAGTHEHKRSTQSHKEGSPTATTPSQLDHQISKHSTRNRTTPIPSKKKKTNPTEEENVSAKKKKFNKNTIAGKLRKKKQVNYSVSGPSCGSEDEQSDYSEETPESKSDQDDIFEKQQKFNIKTPKGKSPKVTTKKNSSSKTRKSPQVCDMLDDDDDFEVSSRPVIRKSSSQSSLGSNKPVQMLNDDSDSDKSVSIISVTSTKGTDMWVEVFLSSQKSWFCIDMVSYSVGKPELCEGNASQPLTYVIGYDNENKVKDVTGRYAVNWLSKTKKMRIDAEWWYKTLLPYKTTKKKMDENEDSQLLEKHQEMPLPKSITEYKNHHLYVLKRHLLKFEGIYPETAATLGFIRGEAIYSRDCVHLLHTREKWMSLEAKVVKQGEQPYKIVKGRIKRNQPVVDPDSVTIDLFGRWQTEDYKPPPAKDGKVPKNEYGNVELFKPSMLPPGTKHLQIPGIQKIAKKLGIDGAPAVVGFEFHCGFCHPIIDGLVVCVEHVPTLMDAWRQEQQEAQRRKEEKREKRVLGNWKLIVKSLVIRERLKRKYNNQESRVSSEQGEVLEEAKIQPIAVAWPQNMKEGKTSVNDDGHCHIFPKKLHKKDKVTGEWTKACACGFTLPLEK